MNTTSLNSLSYIKKLLLSFFERLSPERTFLWLALLFGFLFILIHPPFQVADEKTQFFRMYELSEFHFISIVKHNKAGDYLPESLTKFTEPFFLDQYYANTNVKMSLSTLRYIYSIPLNPNKKVFTPFQNTALYSPIPYLVGSITTLFLRIFEARPIIIFYAPKLVTMIVSALVIYSAIKVTPIFKWVMTTLALMPMTLDQVASFSADSLTIALSFFFVAYILFCKSSIKPKITRKDFIILALTGSLLALTKPVYIFLLPLLLLIPVSKMGNVKKYLLFIASVISISLVGFMIWSIVSAPIYIPARLYVFVDYHEQLKFFEKHTLDVTSLIVQDYASHADTYFEQFTGAFMIFHILLTIILAMIMFLVSLVEKSSKVVISFKDRLLSFCIWLICLYVISLSLYLSWSRIGSSSIDGVQGRYYIPIALALFLCLYNDKIRSSSKALVPMLVSCSAVIALSLTVITWVFHFY